MISSYNLSQYFINLFVAKYLTKETDPIIYKGRARLHMVTKLANIGQQVVKDNNSISPVGCAALSILVKNLEKVIDNLYNMVSDENMKDQMENLMKIANSFTKFSNSSCSGSPDEIMKNIDMMLIVLKGMLAGWEKIDKEHIGYLESIEKILKSMKRVLEQEVTETYITAEYPSIALSFGSRPREVGSEIRLTPLEEEVLKSLKEYPEGVTLSKLASRLNRDKATIYRCLRVLMSIGLVKKETKKGKTIYRATQWR